MMIETELDLAESGTLEFPAVKPFSGQIIFGPVPPHTRWEVSRYTTFCAGAGCTLDVYKNFTLQEANVDSTLAGSSDSGGIQINLGPGERLIFDYNDGQAGEMVSAVIYGTKFVRGNRGYR